MYDIKLGQGCGIKATMLTPAGGVCDLRRARYIAASLVLPSGATMNCEDIAFNEVTNGVYVRLLGTRELKTRRCIRRPLCGSQRSKRTPRRAITN